MLPAASACDPFQTVTARPAHVPQPRCPAAAPRPSRNAGGRRDFKTYARDAGKAWGSAARVNRVVSWFGACAVISRDASIRRGWGRIHEDTRIVSAAFCES